MNHSPEDRILEETLSKQKELIEFYKKAIKQSADQECKDLFKSLAKSLDSDMTSVAEEIAKHRMERKLREQ
ncbi:hypothetical protein Tter_0047 [Thermobaculum terrenum ATCC BAA-798]|uniref:Uncharacterized protein n=1 Tax=Thermobaculum terrenum (strain ATCC BAA-798 / CCMEE 7001 / YNP1) TaxID=525904 RepID=D1CDG4_THET1|nr:hypothetical protein [Thermobaculum terrenum]ACZ40970.1 hypothetical protein Tter_0047 [Thermobaculum terrenum ATCC BAA-798]